MAYYQFETMFSLPVLRHGVFTRLGGSSSGAFASLNVGSTVGDDPDAVRHNRARMAGALGLQDADVRSVWQVHGVEVVVARRSDHLGELPPQADILLTDEPDLPLAMRFADCVPILIVDPVRRVLGMVHAGWRGTVLNAAGAAVAAMANVFGSSPADLIAGVGPSIGPERYEVGPEVISQVESAFDDSDGLLRASERPGHAYLDLWEANRRLLTGAGAGQVEVAALCTAEHSNEFFSHRAEHGRTGRFGMLAMLEGDRWI